LSLRTSIRLRHLLALHLRPFESRPFLTLRSSIYLRHLLPLHLWTLHLRHLLTLSSSIYLRHLLALHLRTLSLLSHLRLRTLNLRLLALRCMRPHNLAALAASAFITAATAFSLALCGNIADRANG
jgi:hypothetical protein